MFINTKINLALDPNPRSFIFSSHVALMLSPLHDVHVRDPQPAQALGGVGRHVGCLMLLLHLDECPPHQVPTNVSRHERDVITMLLSLLCCSSRPASPVQR